MTLPPRVRTGALALGYVTAFVLADKAAAWFAILPGISLWYPPPGLLLALLLVLGLRWLPVALFGALFSAFVVYPMPEWWATVAMACTVAFGYAAVAAALRATLGRPPRIEQISHALGFSLALLVCALPMACVGVSVLQAVDLVPAGEFGRSVFRWWLGDTAGILSLLPLLLIHVAPRLGAVAAFAPSARLQRAWTEITAQVATLLASLAVVYWWPPMRESHVPYLSLVPLTWIVLRHGLPGAALGIFAVNAGSVVVLRLANAPESVLVSFLLFQFATTAMGLALGAMVTRRQRAELEKNRLVEILEATPDFVGSLALDGRMMYSNTAFRQLGGRDDVDDVRPVREFLPLWATEKLFREGIPTALAQGRWTGESAMLDRHGHEIPVSQVVVPHQAPNGKPTAVFLVARDITDQKKAEAQRLESERRMLDAQKLESLGVLAGGVAHDFNNLLTTMLGNANLARLDLPADSAVQRNLKQIEHAALRAAELCQQMLAYSGKAQLETKLIDLSALVSDTAHLLQVSISKKSTLEFELPSNLPPVSADATQLRQIVMNLVLNAAEAIGDEAGLIRVTTGAMRPDAAWLGAAALTPPPPPGDYVFVEVADDGPGMTPDVKARIFEPFFTTKFTGHGLGLSAVLGIVRGHGGTLRVESERGHGARFRVLLPVARGKVPDPAPATPPALWRGKGSILVVDDEETVRVVTARILEGAGFEVEMAADGADALERFSARPDAYRAVLLDLLMPVRDGRQTLEELRRIRPETPVLLISGYAGREGVPQSENTTFVPKPFHRDTLLRVLRGVLERTGASSATAGKDRS